MYTWQRQEAWPEAGVIIHLAGKAHDTKNTTAGHEYSGVNTGLTKQIFDHFLSSDARKFIYFSSVKAVADRVTGDTLTEEANPAPGTHYGRSKLEAERYIAGKAVPPGKMVYILRPCMIHGPGNKGNLNLLWSVVRKGIPWPLGAFENKRSFASVGNLAWIVQQIIARDIPPGIYNIADDEPIPTNQLIRLMAAGLGKPERIMKIPIPLIRGVARAGDLLHLPLNTERLQKLTESYVVSNHKIRRALGVEKLPLSATEGLEITLKSFRSV